MRNREKEKSVRGRGRPSGLALLLNFFWRPIPCVTKQMNGTQRHFPLVLFIMH